jgi:hypothetical protein
LLPESIEMIDEDQAALAAPVKVELLGGVRAGDLARLQRTLWALQQFVPSNDTWNLAEQWAIRGAAKGQRFGSWRPAHWGSRG